MPATGTIPGPRNVISDEAIAAAARAAGFPESQIPTAVAVALAESGGNTLARNQNAPGHGVDEGLWQINTVAHPEKLATMGDWRDPQANANMAYAVWQQAGRSWRPWVTYTHNSHLPYMQRGQAAAASTRQNLQQNSATAPLASASGFDAHPADMQAVASSMNSLLSQATGIVGQVASASLAASAFTQLGAPVAAAGAAMHGQLATTLTSLVSLLSRVSGNVGQAAQDYQAFDGNAAAALDALNRGASVRTAPPSPRFGPLMAGDPAGTPDGSQVA